MKNDKKIMISILYVFLGVILMGLGVAEIVDEFWSGMGSALIAVGILRTVQFCRFRKDEVYRQKVETERTDERNRFIRNKAWAWAGYLFILLVGSCVIILKILGQDLLSMAASGAVCIMLILYWVSYMILRKKY